MKRIYILPEYCAIEVDGNTGEFIGGFDSEIEGTERLLLALSCEGVDVPTSQFHNAIITTLENIFNS